MLEIIEIVQLYNEKGLNLDSIGKEIGKSKSSVQRLLAKGGYSFNKKTSKYEANVSRETINKEQENNNVSRETINNETNETNGISKANVSRETISKTEYMVNRTYAISEQIERAIKIKAAIEGKKPVDIVREALEAYVEREYLKM